MTAIEEKLEIEERTAKLFNLIIYNVPEQDADSQQQRDVKSAGLVRDAMPKSWLMFGLRPT